MPSAILLLIYEDAIRMPDGADRAVWLAALAELGGAALAEQVADLLAAGGAVQVVLRPANAPPAPPALIVAPTLIWQGEGWAVVGDREGTLFEFQTHDRFPAAPALVVLGDHPIRAEDGTYDRIDLTSWRAGPGGRTILRTGFDPRRRVWYRHPDVITEPDPEYTA